MESYEVQLKDFKKAEQELTGKERVFISQDNNTRSTTIDEIRKPLAEQLNENTQEKWDYVIKTTDNPQTIIDNAPAGSKISFTGGIHEHGLSRNNAMISIEKALTLNIPKTATLKVANGSMNVNKNAELITNFNIANPILSLDINSDGYTLENEVRTYYIEIDSTGTPNTFKYKIADFDNALVQDWVTGIAITGNMQILADGIQIQFPKTTGYNLGAGCIVAVGSIGYYVIRVGTGTHENYINGVKITGQGVIDQNQTGNSYSNLFALWLNCGLLINGRVHAFELDDSMRFINCNRSIVVLGENVGGTKNLDGTITGGTSYDVDQIMIRKTITEGNCISGVLFGMPEHRGYIRKLTFDDNFIHCNLTAIEPNNLLENYKITDNILKTPVTTPIHCWRYSKNGTITGNKLIYGDAKNVVTIEAPAGWKIAENIKAYNNESISNSSDGSIVLGNNGLNKKYNTAESAEKSFIGTGNSNDVSNSHYCSILTGENNKITGNYNNINSGRNNNINNALYSEISNGETNIIENSYYASVGGIENYSDKNICRVYGKQAKPMNNYADVWSGGKFTNIGDAQNERYMLRKLTTDNTATLMSLDGANYTSSNEIVIPTLTTVAFTGRVVARSEDGTLFGGWEVKGVINRSSSGISGQGIVVTEIYSSPALIVECLASNMLNALVVRVTGESGKNIRWLANLELTELNF